MMELLNRRISSGDESTLGVLFELIEDADNAPHFECYTLEDQFNEPKVPGETRIPPGRYQIKLRTEGGMHDRYTERFGRFHIGMLWLQDVPNFEWIYIHPGNTDDHSEGCILVGDRQESNVAGRGKVVSSVVAYKRLYEKIVVALEKDEEVWIEIEDFA